MAKKATGEIGSTLITVSAEGTSAKIIHAELPADKEGLEQFFGSRFVATFNETLPLGASVTIKDVKQLDTSDLDFSISSPIADYMELAEINPRSTEFGRAAYRSGRLPVYECAKWIYFKIVRKKMRAYGALSKRVVLLLYATHWQFLTGDRILDCLRSLTQHEGCDFPAVFILKTNGSDLMFLEAVHPYDGGSLPPPGNYRKLTTVNLAPGQAAWTIDPAAEPNTQQLQTVPSPPSSTERPTLTNAELRQCVLATLPEQLLGLLKEIEDYAGLQLEFAINPYPLSPTDPNPQAPGFEVYADRARILLRNTNHIDANGICHVLLGVHRFWNENIPQIMPLSEEKNRWDVTSTIEGSLENLIVVPRQKDYGFDPIPYWTNTFKCNWGPGIWDRITDPFSRNMACLLGWLTCSLTEDKDVLYAAENAIKRQNMWQRAVEFREAILANLQNKPRCISITATALGIPFNEAALVYYDVKVRNRRVEPIPVI